MREQVELAGLCLSLPIVIVSIFTNLWIFGAYAIAWTASLGLFTILFELAKQNSRLSLLFEGWRNTVLVISPGSLVLWFFYFAGVGYSLQEGIEI